MDVTIYSTLKTGTVQLQTTGCDLLGNDFGSRSPVGVVLQSTVRPLYVHCWRSLRESAARRRPRVRSRRPRSENSWDT